METRITATELARSLSDVLNRVRYKEERFVVVRNGEPVATLAPAATSGPRKAITVREFVALLKEIPPAGEDFADDLEAIQASQPRVGPSPWE